MGPRLTDEEVARSGTLRGSVTDPFAHDGDAREEAIEELVGRGYDPDEAEELIDEYEPFD